MAGQGSAQEDHLSGCAQCEGRAAVLCGSGMEVGSAASRAACPEPFAQAFVGPWDVLGVLGVLRNIAFSDS